MNNPLQPIWHLYRDGFRSMTVGRQLWLIILLKLLFMFAILKLFFFRDYLAPLHSDNAKSVYVGGQLIERSGNNASTEAPPGLLRPQTDNSGKNGNIK
jgi:hypothetical protein